MQNNFLVSCSVVTYNSAETVVETLESIKAQTYQNIELIVSDDCSTDDTVSICQEWVESNQSRFVRTLLLTVKKNTGVSSNVNRVAVMCEGEWHKGIAADDILLPTCIEDFVNYVKENPRASWVSSYMRSYNESFIDSNCVAFMVVDSLPFFDKSSQEQLKEIARHNIINAPTLFIRTSLEKEVSYREEYPFEDWPFFVDVLEKGYKCYFMPKETVCYRIHSSASNKQGCLFKYSIALEYRKFEKERLFKYLTKRQIKGKIILWRTQDLIEKFHLNRKTAIMNFVYNKWMAIVLRVYR